MPKARAAVAHLVERDQRAADREAVLERDRRGQVGACRGSLDVRNLQVVNCGRARRAGGAAVLLATHDLAEASSLCDRVVLLHQGRLVAQGRPADLISATAATLADVVLTISGEPGR